MGLRQPEMERNNARLHAEPGKRKKEDGNPQVFWKIARGRAHGGQSQLRGIGHKQQE